MTSAAAVTDLDRSIVPGWLLVAAAAQAGDILIGGRRRMLGMTAGAGVAFAVHLVTALLLLTS